MQINAKIYIEFIKPGASFQHHGVYWHFRTGQKLYEFGVFVASHAVLAYIYCEHTSEETFLF